MLGKKQLIPKKHAAVAGTKGSETETSVPSGSPSQGQKYAYQIQAICDFV